MCRMGGLLQVLNFKRGHRTHAIRNRISQLSLDFLILNPDTSIVAPLSSMILPNSTRTGARRMPQEPRVAVRPASL